MRAIANRCARQFPTNYFFVFLIAVMHAGTAAAEPPEVEGISTSRQMIVVLTRNWDDFHGSAQRYERPHLKSKWHAAGQPFPVVVGKNGLGWGRGLQPSAEIGAGELIKKEGDGKAPAGIFALSRSFGYSAKALLKTRLPYIPLTTTVECVDDPRSSHYNQVLDAEGVTKDWNSFEQMRRDDELYRWGVLVAYNTNPVQPGAGSCIFLHIWGSRDQGTAGCTAMTRSNVESLLHWLDLRKHPVLVQLPEAEYSHYQEAWSLPRELLSSSSCRQMRAKDPE